MFPPLHRTSVLIIAAFSLALALAESGRGGATPDPASPEVRSILRSLSEMKVFIERGAYDSVLAAAPKVEEKVKAERRPDLEIQLGRFVGGAHLGKMHYREALKVLLRTRQKAIATGDNRSLYSLDSNLASLYIQMNNLDSATEFADEALTAHRAYWERHSGSGEGAEKSRSQPVLLRAYIYSHQQKPDIQKAEPLYSEAISYQMDTGDFEGAARAWHWLGEYYFEAGKRREAEIAQTEAFRLLRVHHLVRADAVLRDLSDVLAARGEIRTASVLMDEALSSAEKSAESSLWAIFEDRGQLRRMKGDETGALSDLRASLDLARDRDVIPTDDDRVAVEKGLAELYSEFIDAGNAEYLRHRDPKLAKEIFEAAEENRAASLRALVPQPHGWRTRLPAEHKTVLAQLQSAERVGLVTATAANEEQVRNLREKLHAIEFQAGVENGTNPKPAWETANLALDPRTAILSFHLGLEKSWIWSLTSERFDIHELPARKDLAADAEKFRKAVKTNSADTDKLGAALGERLFGSLPVEAVAKHRWIVVLDQDLFGLPLPALRLQGRYLAEDHALLVTPGIRLLEPAAVHPSYRGSMAGLGDAIYNQADERWRSDRGWFGGWFDPSWFDPSPLATRGGGLNLARLSGTGNEVRTALGIWGEGAVLTGDEATKANLDRMLSRNPAILHLATHVIKSRQYRSGVIVLGLNGSGVPDLLDMHDILLRQVKTQLVVMSGCASGDAEALPASGLMGLTRAWMGAGAGEVLATMWPELDDSGPFFASFYGNLKKNPELGAAEALRRAQVEMLYSRTFRSNPDYWASYFLVGKV